MKRLGFPDLWTDDGPHGVRPDVLWDEWEQAGQTNDSCVAFPALTCLTATWNPCLSKLYGESLGEEALYRGKHVMLGPGVNINRTPLNGRNFEYMGEDPWLASRMVVGISSSGECHRQRPGVARDLSPCFQGCCPGGWGMGYHGRLQSLSKPTQLP